MAINDANKNSCNLSFEAEMFKAADKLRGNMKPLHSLINLNDFSNVLEFFS